MTVWATSSDVLSDVTSDVVRSKTFRIPVVTSGLKPGAKYVFFLDGIDYSWACRPTGGRLGADLRADASGKLSFLFLYDAPFHLSNGTNRGAFVETNRLVELRGPDSVATTFLPFRTLTT